MTILNKSIFVVKPGEVYPSTYEAGSICPHELLEIAASLDAIEGAKKPVLKNKAINAAPENKGGK